MSHHRRKTQDPGTATGVGTDREALSTSSTVNNTITFTFQIEKDVMSQEGKAQF